MFAFDHAPREHDDRFASEPVIAKGELRLVGSRYLDETGETDVWGEPLGQPPPGWASVQHNPMLRGAPQ